MNYISENGCALISGGGGFDLKNTFDCGQCFRWEENPDSSWSGIVRGKKLTLRSTDRGIIIENVTPGEMDSLWSGYFDLDEDYDEIRSSLRTACPALSCAVDSIDGIRILSQEPWEALCSFIISQNNKIPRIKGIISRLCEGFGDDCGGYYSFPDAQRLAGLEPEDLSDLRAGFRAKYIIDAARRVASDEVKLYSMYDRPIDECRTELMKIKGVGAKVAECTLLYGLHRLEAFPVDVWMKKAMSTLFSDVTIEQLGQHAGIAQQYIFHYSRLNPELVQ